MQEQCTTYQNTLNTMLDIIANKYTEILTQHGIQAAIYEVWYIVDKEESDKAYQYMMHYWCTGMRGRNYQPGKDILHGFTVGDETQLRHILYRYPQAQYRRCNV